MDTSVSINGMQEFYTAYTSAICLHLLPRTLSMSDKVASFKWQLKTFANSTFNDVMLY